MSTTTFQIYPSERRVSLTLASPIFRLFPFQRWVDSELRRRCLRNAEKANSLLLHVSPMSYFYYAFLFPNWKSNPACNSSGKARNNFLLRLRHFAMFYAVKYTGKSMFVNRNQSKVTSIQRKDARQRKTGSVLTEAKIHTMCG